MSNEALLVQAAGALNLLRAKKQNLAALAEALPKLRAAVSEHSDAILEEARTNHSVAVERRMLNAALLVVRTECRRHAGLIGKYSSHTAGLLSPAVDEATLDDSRDRLDAAVATLLGWI